MTVRVHGSDAASEQPKRRTWSARDGWATVRTWEGSAEAVEKLITEIQKDCDQLEHTQGAKHILSATFSNDGETTGGSTSGDDNTTWELVGNDLEKDLKSHPDFCSTSANRAAVAQVDADLNNSEKNVSSINYNTGGANKGNDYRDLKLKGVESYLQSQYVVRITQVVSSKDSIKASFTDVNRKASPPSPPNTTRTKFSLPSGEWLKKTPTVRALGHGKFEISQEYWHAEKWSSLLYGGTAQP